MIELVTQGDKCNECPYFEAETLMRKTYANNKVISVTTKVVCKNQELCNQLEAWVREYEHR